MTYPQYQQPQGYGPQAPYQQPPQAAPSYPQYGAPAPQQAPQFGGQPIVPPVPQLGQGGGGGGAAAPKPRHLIGRTVILEPIRIDETAMDTTVNPPVSRPEAYFHLTVVDGGPLRYGDNQSKNISEQRPNAFEIDTPCRFTNVNERGSQIVAAMRDALNAGEVARTGVIEQGTKGGKPFMLTKCTDDVDRNPRPGGDARYAAAMELFGKLWADKHAAPGAPKQFISPEPRSLVAPPPTAAAQPQINYGAPAQLQPQPQPAATMPAGAYGMQGEAYGYPAAAPAPQSAPPNGAPFYGMQPTAPAAPALPQGVETWLATLPPEQAAQQRAAFLAQGAAPAGPGI